MIQGKMSFYLIIDQKMTSNHHHENLDIDYLLKENRKLRLQLKQATALSALHKRAVIDMSQKIGDSHEVVKTLTEIIRNSKEESVKERLRDEVFALEGQIMVLEKIVNQTYENEKETYMLLVEEFKKMQEENTKMELQLHKFYEKIGEVDYLSGLVTKYKEITTPAEFAISARKEQEQLLDMLNLQREQIRKLSEQKEKLLKINVHMKEEVERKKDQVKNMTMMILNDERNFDPSNNTMILADLDLNGEEKLGQSMINLRNNLSTLNVTQANNLNTTLNFVKLQRQLIKEVDESNYNEDSEDSGQFDCPELSILFPDKVQQIRTNKQEAKVPYLNMKKVRELMMKRQQKMRKQIEAQGHHVNPTNKIIQLQKQLEITRKEVTSQMLKFRTMIEDNKKMTHYILQLQQRNETLIKSNETLTNNYRNIYKDYQLCKGITNEVERLLGKKINNEKNVIDAREELSTIVVGSGEFQGRNEDRTTKIVRFIFRDRPHLQQRSLSP